LFVFEDKQVVTYFKGVDPNFSQVNDIKKHCIMDNGLSLIPIRLLRIWNCTEVLNGIADFNKQLEILVPKPEKELLQIPQAFNKTDVFL
jgi:lipoprotein-releasing system permease protein